MQKKYWFFIKKISGKLIILSGLILLLLLTKVVYWGAQYEVLFDQGEDSFQRMELFFAYDNPKSEEDVKNLQTTILDSYYLQSGKEKDEIASNVYDTYMGMTNLTFQRKNDYYESEVYVVGEHYFSFHKYHFLSGNGFLTESDHQNHVIISKSLAFQIFGSTNVCGQSLMCNGKVLVVSGVIEDDNTLLDRMVGNNKVIAYLPYDSVVTEVKNTPVISYEIISQEWIDGFSKKVLYDALQVDRYNASSDMEKRGVEVIEQTGRFDLVSNLKRIVNFKDRIIQKRAFVYPRWENTTRVMELFMFVITLFLVVEIVVILYRHFINIFHFNC